MIVRVLTILLFAAAFAGEARAQAVSSCSSVEADGSRTLCHEALIAAPVGDVWALLASEDGLRTWLAPVVAFELRDGGVFETSYNASREIGDPRNIVNRVVMFEPERLLVIEVARAPDQFPHADEVRQLRTTIGFERIGETETRVRVSMAGYREGVAFDELYAFFDAGNAWTLNALIDRVRTGAKDWSAARVE